MVKLTSVLLGVATLGLMGLFFSGFTRAGGVRGVERLGMAFGAGAEALAGGVWDFLTNPISAILGALGLPRLHERVPAPWEKKDGGVHNGDVVNHREGFIRISERDLATWGRTWV